MTPTRDLFYPDFPTLVDAVRGWAERRPDHIALAFLPDGEREQARLTYAGIDRAAHRTAAGLRQLAAPGDRVLLCCSSSPDFVASFLGCLYAGIIAVPVPAPGTTRHVDRLSGIVADSGATLVLADADTFGRFEVRPGEPFMGIRWATVPDLQTAAEDTEWNATPPDPGGIAFLQYTSGSTSTPKGVVVSHRNLAVNIAMMARSSGMHPGTRIVSWLPIHHDMGLIGALLLPLWQGLFAALMPPAAFIRDPMRWLRAISRYRATLVHGPNFAYELCCGRASGKDLTDLDLSSLETVVNAAEPIRPATLERFSHQFAPAGFRRSSFYPSYGLAEATLVASGGYLGAEPGIVVDPDAFEQDRVVDAASGAPGRTVVNCGRPSLGFDVAIVDPETLRACGPDEVGEIWLAGESVALGYWNNPEATASDFGVRLPSQPGHAFLRTGDLGFLRDGELYVTGRLKDLIIVAGRNHYPQDVEATVEEHPAIRTSNSIAFALTGDDTLSGDGSGDDGEQLGIVAEVRGSQLRGDLTTVAEELAAAIWDAHELRVREVALIRPGALPKTSSGKLRRRYTRELLRGNELKAVLRWPEAGAPADSGPDTSLRLRLEQLPEADRGPLLREAVTGELATVLGRSATDGVTPDRPLRELGLDSLQAVRLQRRLADATGLALPPTLLYDHTTPAEVAAYLGTAWNVGELMSAAERAGARLLLDGNGPDGDRLVVDAPPGALTGELRSAIGRYEAELIAALRHGETDTPILPAGGDPTDDGDPLSAGQAGLWLIERSHGASALYHVHFRLRWTGPLDRDILASCLRGVIARHAALRTRFTDRDGTPRALVSPATDVELGHLDLRGRPDAADAADTAIADQQHTAFDLNTGPLLRALVITRADHDHLISVTQHHIITDGWSIGLLLTELLEDYRAAVLGEPLHRPVPALQYADYARWQQSRRETPAYRRTLDWWDTHLDQLEPLPLGRGGPRSSAAAPSHHGATESFELPAEHADALRDVAKSCDTTLYTVLLAAWAAVLQRHTGQDDFAIGTITSGRARAELERMVGFFSNTVVLRCDLSGDPAATELIGRLGAETSAAFAHEVPFADVVVATGAAGAAGGSDLNPLVQAAFIFENAQLTPGAEADLLPGLDARAALEGRIDAAVEGTAKFDLSLVVSETGAGLTGLFEYATSTFDPADMVRLRDHFLALLRSLTDRPGDPVSSFDLVGDAERRELTGNSSGPRLDFPRDQGLHQLFEAQARRTPDRVAAVQGERTVTYAELDAWAEHLAGLLATGGLRAGENVGVALHRSLELIAAELAVLKAGGTVVPLDPDLPADRLTFLLTDSASRFVLSDSGTTLPSAVGGGVGIGRIDADRERTGGARAVPARGTGGDSVAYVLYTSGSTGTPKGVLLPHRAIVRLVVSGGLVPVDADTRSAFASSPSFDVATLEMWGPLLCGGQVAVISRDEVLDPRRFGAALTRHGVNLLWLTAGLFNEYADQLTEQFGALRHLVVGGDALTPDVVAGVLRSNHPPQHLVNGYGPTESTFAASYEVPGPPDGWRSIPIGRPLPNTRIYLLDGQGRPVPVGVTGELYLGGEGLAHGYLNQPGLTAQRFLPNPYADEPGARMYRTGDLGRWLPDGTIEFLGRDDFQVKVRGFRVELGEIEARLREHPAVGRAVVLAREDSPGAKRLVAYYVSATADAPDAPDAEELRGHLARTLPPYMVPAAFVRLDRLPLTPTGKVARQSLPAPADDALVTRAYAAPQGEVEQRLADVWADLLGVDRVGRGDNFFDLGGHSLLATQVMSRLRQAFGVDVAVSALFARPVLADFATEVAAAAATGPAPDIAPDPDGGNLVPLAQTRMWFIAQLPGGSEAYHMPTGLELRGRLDRQALRSALDTIVARHDALRAVFAVDGDGQPVQRVVPAADVRFDLLEQHAADDTELTRLAHEEARKSFDLTVGPLVRGRLISQGEDRHTLLITMHHIISDGWSVHIFLRELAALYGALAQGRAPELPELAMQYRDYAAWQAAQVSEEQREQQRSYWQGLLAGSPAALRLPLDRPRPAHQDRSGDVVPIDIPPELARRLNELARRHDTTLFMTLLSSWALLLSRLGGDEDLVIGIPSASRRRPEAEALIGFFVNTLPIRVDLTGPPDVGELLGRVTRRVLDAMAHQDVHFEEIVDLANPVRSAAHDPLTQVLFAWLPDLGPIPQLSGVDTDLMPTTSYGTSRVDLMLSLREGGDTLGGWLEYATALFDRATAERMVRCYLELLQAMVDHAEAPVARLPILPNDQYETVVDTFNPGDSSVDPKLCLHETFEAQATATPDAVALVHRDTQVTYRELNEQANRIAHRLRAAGVGPGVRVGICAERGVGLLAAVVGVLKAGGAYVPLDPSYPAERVAFMLADAKPMVVLTDGAEPAALIQATAPEDTVVWDLATDFTDAPAGNVPVAVSPSDVAYVIYTSGSTGTPKGVLVEHRQVARLFTATDEWFGFGPSDVWALCHSYAFDFSVWEIWGALLHGGQLVIVPSDVVRAPDELWQLLCSAGVTVLCQTPGAFTRLTDARLRTSGAEDRLRFVIFGGEALEVAALRPWFDAAAGGGPTLVNMYGITETTVHVTWQPIEPDMAGGLGGSLIGRPIPDLRVYVVDAHGRPAPVGVVGELMVGGRGVTRGYLGRPGLTAERFVPNWLTGDGTRLYRTGDLGRWLPDGTLEFMGRNDFQVKVRGYRIELGEIEARLLDHDAVREAVVVAREDVPGDKRLVAYLGVQQHSGAYQDDEESAEQLEHWRQVFDVTYDDVLTDDTPDTAPAPVDPTFDIRGWNSSYTREPIPAEQMREWVDHTADLILATRPESVLDIGCGTGLTVFAAGPRVRTYWGTDLSAVAVRNLRRAVAESELPPGRVTLFESAADDLDRVLPAQTFDVAVLNSVVQYFPDEQYLLAVIEAAVRRLAPGGTLVVGDVRSLPMLRTFHTTVQATAASPDTPADQLRARIDRAVADDEELVIDPHLFTTLPARIPDIAGVRVTPRRGRHDNEMTAFRYDVQLIKSGGPAPEAPTPDTVDWLDWQGENLTVDGLWKELTSDRPDLLAVHSIPNARLRPYAGLLEQPPTEPTVDPEDLIRLGADTGYRIDLDFAEHGEHGELRLVARRCDETGEPVVGLPDTGGPDTGGPGASGPGASGPGAGLPDGDPLWSAFVNSSLRRTTRRLVTSLRSQLDAHLPGYMMPSAYVFLDEMPLTPNGKVDRRALPAPGATATSGQRYEAPDGPVETTLAGLWADLLRLDQVGRHDNFFELGGNSLLAVSLVERMHAAGLPGDVRTVFTAPTVAGMADAIAELEPGADEAAVIPPNLIPDLPGDDPDTELEFTL
ncbi:non-ribosomal peptide synthetase [Streptomyces sp. RTd22]|uniref:non-ribosomal peptide synthetase n=1 Tax=Streptomyces sp. RTd22 TaxID=1841249 RepID=UPI0007C4F5C1|nr:non-ribosomal peptide synthetase [Streptomyces sp. RTd22]